MTVVPDSSCPSFIWALIAASASSKAVLSLCLPGPSLAFLPVVVSVEKSFFVTFTVATGINIKPCTNYELLSISYELDVRLDHSFDNINNNNSPLVAFARCCGSSTQLIFDAFVPPCPSNTPKCAHPFACSCFIKCASSCQSRHPCMSATAASQIMPVCRCTRITSTGLLNAAPILTMTELSYLESRYDRKSI